MLILHNEHFKKFDYKNIGSVETGMNMNGSHPAMKNCEGTNGIQNRLLGGQGRSFQGN